MKKTLVPVIALVAASASAVDPLALAPFTFAGRVVDYAHIAYDAATSVEVRVETADGTLLAKTSTATAGHTAYNYIVDIPVSNRPMPGYVLPGTPVVIRLVDPDGRRFTGLPVVSPGGVLPVVPDGAPVPSSADGDVLAAGNPGEHRSVDVILATDANGDGVSDEYVEMLAYLMWKKGIETYDPSADWDGDGASNFDEYVTGTNPFDATDMFSIRRMADESGMGDYVAVTFMVNQGRAYVVETTEMLEPDYADWKPTAFSVADPASALTSVLHTGALETGYRTLYVRRGDGSRRFWRLKAE